VCRDDKDRAKEIFIAYHGNHFQMEREGVYSEYKKRKITKKQEHQWIHEYQTKFLLRFEKEDLAQHCFNNLCTSIRQYRSIDSLKQLTEIVVNKREKLDTFTALLMAEGILDIVDRFQKSYLRFNKNTIFAKNASINFLKGLLERPITVSEKYLDADYNIIDWGNPQNIIDRIKDELGNWN
jgi:hypothetical protein